MSGDDPAESPTGLVEIPSLLARVRGKESRDPGAPGQEPPEHLSVSPETMDEGGPGPIEDTLDEAPGPVGGAGGWVVDSGEESRPAADPLSFDGGENTPPEGIKNPLLPPPLSDSDDDSPPHEPAKTQVVLQEDVNPHGDGPRLIMVQGQDIGREIELLKEEFRIGRATDNDLVLADIACSRHHAVVAREGEDYFITDLGSGNGTLHNGKKVQRIRLGNGDEIAIGRTVLGYHDPGTLTDPARLHRGLAPQQPTSIRMRQPIPHAFSRRFRIQSRKRILILAGGAVLVLLGASGLKLYLKARPGPRVSEVARSLPPAQLEALLLEARRLVKERSWTEAEEPIRQVLELDPQNRMALEYREYLKREGNAKAALASAGDLLGQKKVAEAIKALSSVGEASVYHEEARKRAREMGESALPGLLSRARQLHQEKNSGELQALLLEILSLDAQQPEAKRWLAELQSGTGAPVREGGHRRRDVPQAVVAHMQNGELDRAIRAADGQQLRELFSRLKRLEQLLERGERQTPTEPEKAVDGLHEALQIESEIVGKGKMHERIGALLVDAHFQLGLKMQRQKKSPEAFQQYQMALHFDAEYQPALRKMKDIEQTVKELYEEAYAYQQADPEKALKNLGLIQGRLPVDHPYYQKASRLKHKLQHPAPESSDSPGDPAKQDE